MINGSYRQKIEWARFECPAAFELFRERALVRRSYSTCGSAALGLLVNQPAAKVETKLPKTVKHWSDRATIHFLLNRRFNVTQVSKYGVTNIDPNGDWEATPLNRKHVLLCNLLMCRDEASWFVITNNHSFHNYGMEELNPLFFFNKPSQSVYLVSHPSWK